MNGTNFIELYDRAYNDGDKVTIININNGEAKLLINNDYLVDNNLTEEELVTRVKQELNLGDDVNITIEQAPEKDYNPVIETYDYIINNYLKDIDKLGVELLETNNKRSKKRKGRNYGSPYKFHN